MRKLLGLICMIVLVSCEKPPVDSVVLKIMVQPQTNYKFTSEQTLATVISYSGKQKILQELKRRGHENPTVLNKQSTTIALITTGKPEDENTRFPVKVEYSAVISSNGKKEDPVNVLIHGKCLMDSIPVFDLAVNDQLDRHTKLILLESWKKSFSQVSFSGEKIKIGEEFTVQNPLSIPMEGSEIEMMVTTRYKLISIKDDIANLEVSQEYTLSPRLMDNSFQGSGKGEGHLSYDMKNSIVTDYALNNEMELNKKLDSFEFHLKTNSQLTQKISITSKPT